MDALASLLASLDLLATPSSHNKPRLRPGWTTVLLSVLLIWAARPVVATPTTPKSYIAAVHPAFPTITPLPALNAGSLELALPMLVVEERDSPIWKDDSRTIPGEDESSVTVTPRKAKREGDSDQAAGRDRETPSSGPTTATTPYNDGRMTALSISLTRTAARSAPTPTATLSQPTRAFPIAFDGAAAYNFTSGSPCPYFLNDLLLDDTFQACRPLSMLIMTSRGLFDAAKQLVSLVEVLDAACSVSSASCAAYLSAKADALLADSTCAAEYRTRHPMVMEAYDGLRSYQMVYSATCLQDPTTALYCYANAMTNLTSAADAYMYFLPYNLSLPTSAAPSCSWCTQSTLEVFRSAAADRSQAIADTYSEAANLVDGLCGRNFVTATLPARISQAAFSVPWPPTGLGLFVLAVFVASIT